MSLTDRGGGTITRLCQRTTAAADPTPIGAKPTPVEGGIVPPLLTGAARPFGPAVLARYLTWDTRWPVICSRRIAQREKTWPSTSTSSLTRPTRAHVKIGKTTLTLERRAEDLSAATGVLHPFLVAYGREVTDCNRAEGRVHEALKDWRVTADREFFQVKATVAINTLLDRCSDLLVPRNLGPAQAPIDHSALGPGSPHPRSILVPSPTRTRQRDRLSCPQPQ